MGRSKIAFHYVPFSIIGYFINNVHIHVHIRIRRDYDTSGSGYRT